MPSSHLIPCHPLLLLPSIFPSIIYMYTHKIYFLCIYHIYTVNEIPEKGTLETVICSSYWEKGIGFIWKKQRALFPFLTLLLSAIADAGLAQPTPKVTVPICIIFTSTFSLSLSPSPHLFSFSLSCHQDFSCCPGSGQVRSPWEQISTLDVQQYTLSALCSVFFTASHASPQTCAPQFSTAVPRPPFTPSLLSYPFPAPLSNLAHFLGSPLKETACTWILLSVSALERPLTRTNTIWTFCFVFM